VRFSLIHAEKAFFPVAALCRLLGVTRQGYYAFARRSPSKRVLAEAELCESVRKIFIQSEERYGSPRVLRELRNRGIRSSKRRIERAMRGMGLTPPAPRRNVRTTVRDLRHPVAPNELARDFSATRPNERWVTDITYVRTDEGWAYVAIILDLFSRAVVGWSLDVVASTRMVLTALQNAVQKRRPGAGLLHHSDRGCQYTSSEYRQRLEALGLAVTTAEHGWVRWRSLYVEDPEGNMVELVCYDRSIVEKTF